MGELINTSVIKDLGAPVTLGVELPVLSTQTEGFSGLGLSLAFTADKKLPFNSSRYTFQNDKGEPLFVTGFSLGLSATPTLNIIRDSATSGLFSFAGEAPIELRVPVPLGNSALAVLYGSSKWSYSGAEAVPAPVEGADSTATPATGLVPTATYGFSFTAGAAFYLTKPKDGKFIVGSPFVDANVTYAPQNFIDGLYTFSDMFSPTSEIPKTEWSFTVQPPAAWTGKVAGFKANYKLTSTAREVTLADGVVVTDYRDADHKFTLTGALPFVNKSKLTLKLERAWTDDMGAAEYHVGSGNAHGQTLGATATIKTPWSLLGGRGSVSVDQALAEGESYERLSDQVPFELSLGFSQKDQSYLSDGLYLYSEGAPVLGEDGKPVAYDGSATPYDTARLPNSDPSINDEVLRTVTLGFKSSVPLGPGQLTTTISLPFNVSPGAENEDFFDRFRDPTGNAHTITVGYEVPFGGGGSHAAKAEKSATASRVFAEWTFIREDLTRAAGKYKFTDDQAYAARDVITTYMTAKDTNWTDLQKEFDGLVKDEDHDNSDLTMHDFIIILEWCNDSDRGIGAFKGVAEKKGRSLHDFAQEWKAAKDAE